MKTKILTVLIGLFASLTSFAAPAGETVKVVQVLKGDTMIVSRRGHLGSNGGSGIYVHIAGVDAPELTQSGGQASFNYLSNLTLGRLAYMIIVQQSGNHAIARMYLGDGGRGSDIGALVVQNGWGFFRNEEESGLSSVERASFDVLSQRAKYKKIGLWANGDMNYTITADSFRGLETWKNNQQYVNGATPPQESGFNRPQFKKDPQDWRQPVGHH